MTEQHSDASFMSSIYFPEAKEASAKWWKKNGSGVITDIVNDIVNKLPVEYNLAAWVTTKLEV
jgi:hypothetical protein